MDEVMQHSDDELGLQQVCKEVGWNFLYENHFVNLTIDHYL